MSSGEDSGERNPFAPPSADAPDQPWQPRGPQAGEDGREDVPPPQNSWQLPPQPPTPKFDPSDPVQRRARYALSAGMGGLFCAVTDIWYLALLLGALAVYWAISSLRAEPSKATGTRPQTPAALGGLLTGGVAVLFIALLLGLHVVYKDYVTCLNDALTDEAQHSCDHLGPQFLVHLTNSDGQ